MLPTVGSIWLWEPENDYARDICQVMEVRWNGEEWYIASKRLPTLGGRIPIPDATYWNSLGRWWESAHEVVMKRV